MWMPKTFKNDKNENSDFDGHYTLYTHHYNILLVLYLYSYTL